MTARLTTNDPSKGALIFKQFILQMFISFLGLFILENGIKTRTDSNCLSDRIVTRAAISLNYPLIKLYVLVWREYDLSYFTFWIGLASSNADLTDNYLLAATLRGIIHIPMAHGLWRVAMGCARWLCIPSLSYGSITLARRRRSHALLRLWRMSHHDCSTSTIMDVTLNDHLCRFYLWIITRLSRVAKVVHSSVFLPRVYRLQLWEYYLSVRAQFNVGLTSCTHQSCYIVSHRHVQLLLNWRIHLD